MSQSTPRRRPADLPEDVRSELAEIVRRVNLAYRAAPSAELADLHDALLGAVLATCSPKREGALHVLRQVIADEMPVRRGRWARGEPWLPWDEDGASFHPAVLSSSGRRDEAARIRVILAGTIAVWPTDRPGWQSRLSIALAEDFVRCVEHGSPSLLAELPHPRHVLADKEQRWLRGQFFRQSPGEPIDLTRDEIESILRRFFRAAGLTSEDARLLLRDRSKT